MNDASSASAEADSGALLSRVLTQINRIILGKNQQVELALSCLLTQGHLLIEDVPGLGKTVLAQALGRSLGLSYQRVQCTSDLLPGDILGCSVFDRNRSEFVFSQGPVFTQLLLADEINRATPKCQSALLEAMEERQVSVEGQARALPEPFFVIATQNPVEQNGTFPLPESELDRFLLRLSMGYPGREAELELLRGEDRRTLLETIEPVTGPQQLLDLQNQVRAVESSDAVLDYLHRLLEYTRRSEHFQTGLSTRAGLGLLRAAQAWALLHGERMLLPGDIQQVFPALAGHRLVPLAARPDAARIGEDILAQVPVD